MTGSKRATIWRHPAGRGIGVGLVCALLAWLLGHTEVARGLESWMLDACFSARGVRPTKARIVIVGIDEDTMHQLRKPVALFSPELAEVIRYLKSQEAAAVGVDVFIPDLFGDVPAIRLSDRNGYAVPMGEAVRAAGNVVLPEWFGRDGLELPLPQWRRDPRAEVGFLNLHADSDKFVRRCQLVRDERAHFAMLTCARSRAATYHWDAAQPHLSINGAAVPLDDKQLLRINYVGPADTFPELSFWNVLQAARADETLPGLRGAIVFIGVTSWTEEDLVAIPFSNNYVRFAPSGAESLMGATEVHANIAATLIDEAYILPPPLLNSLVFLLAAGAVLGAIYARVTLGWGLLLMLGHHIGWRFVAALGFAWANWSIDVVPMALLGIFGVTATYGLRWRSVRRTLGMLRSEHVARAIEQDSRKLDLGGEERLVTVLVADIRGFTTFSEAHSAQQVMALINAYFGAIVPVIEAEGGAIISFLGDGILVLFGAPGRSEDHALRAVRAAVGVVRRVHELTAAWAEHGLDDLAIGIGVHSGRAIIGTIGSAARREFTAIGDTVNTAFRIETENKPQGSEILVSATTWSMLPEDERGQLGFAAAPIPALLKGKADEILVYPVIVPR